MSVPTTLRPSAPLETSAFIWTLMRPWRHTSPELLQAVSASCASCGASRGRCLVMLLCRSSPVLCCWSTFLKGIEPIPSRHRHCSSFGLSCYESRSHHTSVGRPTPATNPGKDPVQAMCPCVQVSTWSSTTLPVRPTSTSRSNGAQTASKIIEFASARHTSY